MASVWKIIFYFGVMTLPFYPFNSGGVQPSHAMLAIAFAIMVLHLNLKIKVNLLGKVYLLMTVYILLRELTVTLGSTNLLSLLSPIYFLFNFMVLVIVHNLDVQKSKLSLAVFLSGIIAMLGVALIGVSFVREETTFRAIGTFNNPNQLGYFSVCFLSLSFLFYICGRVSVKMFLALMAVGFFCGFVSLSKSAIVSNMMVLFAFLLSINLGKKILILLSMFLILVVVILYDLIPVELIQSSELYYRFDKFGQESDSSLASRGYLLVFESGPFHLMFGMGKQGVKDYFGLETHSSIMSMLNSYGLIGLLFFLILIAIWFYEIYRAFGISSFMGICLPVILYGLAHNGNRFVMFWLLVATSLSLARLRVQARMKNNERNTSLGGVSLSSVNRSFR